MHEVTFGCGLSEERKAKILERANVHQLIILENPPPSLIETASAESSPIKLEGQ